MDSTLASLVTRLEKVTGQLESLSKGATVPNASGNNSVAAFSSLIKRQKIHNIQWNGVSKCVPSKINKLFH
jgi:hypothetical protein